MKLIKLLFLFIVVIKAEDEIDPEITPEIKEDGGVLVLTKENFDHAMKIYPSILVKFYAPWCGHCKAMAGDYKKVAKNLKEQNHITKVGKVDVTVENELGEKYKVQGFPTLKYFHNGNPSEYQGPRDAKGILKWLERRTGEPTTEITNWAGINDITSKNDIVVLGFFSDNKSKDAEAFRAAARENDGQLWAITKADEVLKEYERKNGDILLIKQFDEPLTDYEGEKTTEAISKWVKMHSIPIVNEFTSETSQDIFETDVKGHLLLFTHKSGENADEKALKEQLDALRSPCKKFRGDVICVYIDVDNEENQQVLEYFGKTVDDAPYVTLFSMEENTKYFPEEENFEIKDKFLIEWIQKFVEGKLTPFYKSQKLPEDWDKEDVKVLVTDNFDQVTQDESKDVLVEFYAPWCGHCQKLEPVYKKLAKAVKDNTDILITKIDATENDKPAADHEVEGFPTIKLFKKGSNQILDYQGSMDLESLKKFVTTYEQDEAEDDYEDYDEHEEHEEHEEDLEELGVEEKDKKEEKDRHIEL